MHHRNSRQHKLPDSTAVAENRIAGGVGEVTGAIPFPRPDPGFGNSSCAELAGKTGNKISRFDQESSLAINLGMSPLDNASGIYRGGKIPTQVNKRAKKAMITAIEHHLRNLAQFQAFYEKKRAQGKKHNQAIRALGRNLCEVIFKMLKEIGSYEIRS